MQTIQLRNAVSVIVGVCWPRLPQRWRHSRQCDEPPAQRAQLQFLKVGNFGGDLRWFRCLFQFCFGCCELAWNCSRQSTWFPRPVPCSKVRWFSTLPNGQHPRDLTEHQIRGSVPSVSALRHTPFGPWSTYCFWSTPHPGMEPTETTVLTCLFKLKPLWDGRDRSW